ncbi:MAG: ImmA/IrrE family metallo-endopeptidase [Dialister sp.]|uniref:ImmA/IrrE family metallo-endopeptidase n=1 Tax=Dialister sp. TaxID=1955814 RepID=UPI001E0EF261|nr:ImmA/IrrE family metallo-endopeptidase [Dialister sp.]MBS6715065.1 ImmA/IrrE family metallo-endopeptidase [Dialister sp.]
MLQSKEGHKNISLNPKSIKHVNQVITELKRQWPQLRSPNFDLIKFLTENYDFMIREVAIKDDTTGFILVDDKKPLGFKSFSTHKLIVINALLSNNPDYIQKRRFIVAHEFGHYLLHKHDQIQFAKRDSGHFDSPEEQEAEYFARCILMPEEIIRDTINRINQSPIDQKVEAISKMCNVTKKKADYRLRELGIINDE